MGPHGLALPFLPAAQRTGALASEASGGLPDLPPPPVPGLLVLSAALEFAQDPVAEDEPLEGPEGGLHPPVVHDDLQGTAMAAIPTRVVAFAIVRPTRIPHPNPSGLGIPIPNRKPPDPWSQRLSRIPKRYRQRLEPSHRLRCLIMVVKRNRPAYRLASGRAALGSIRGAGSLHPLPGRCSRKDPGTPPTRMPGAPRDRDGSKYERAGKEDQGGRESLEGPRGHCGSLERWRGSGWISRAGWG